MSFEVQVGAADVYGACHESGCTSNVYPLPVVAGSVGWWVTPQLAIHLRLFDLLDHDAASIETLLLIGPGFQFWPHDRVWLGAALGPDIYAGKNNPAVTVGGDLRAGFVVFSSHADTFSVSAEVSPAVASDNLTTFALLVAYQRL